MTAAIATAPAPIPGLRSAFATVDGVRLHYRIGGDPKGQPVVLWHGFLSTGRSARARLPGRLGGR